MIALKLLAIVITMGAGLLQIGLEYKWSDRRTKKHKMVRTCLVMLMIVGSLATSLLVLYDDSQSETQVRNLTTLKENAEKAAKDSEKRELEAIKDRGRIKEELEKLRVQISPVVRMATEKYPTLDINSALEKLADDVQALQKQNIDLQNKANDSTKELVKLQQEVAPRHLTDVQRNAILEYLKLMPQYGVIVAGRIMDYESSSYADDFADVLRKAKWDLRVSNTSTNMFKGICIYTNVENGYHPGEMALHKALNNAGIETVKATIGKRSIIDMPENTLFLIIGIK